MFSVFLLISVFIWLLNALGKNYTSVIEYPIVYTDFPVNKVPVGEMPGNLDLRIHAQGYALLRYKMFRKPVPISFQVSAYNLRKAEEDNESAYIITRYLKDQLSRQLPSELQLLGIQPDTLFFQFADQVSRKMKIMPDFAFEVDKQFTIRDEIVLNPDSVEVTGPDLILDTLQYIYTVRTELGLLTKDYNDKIKLRKIPDLKYDRSRINCRIYLERFTEVQFSIPVKVINLPDTIFLQTFPSHIKLTCKVGLSKYERMDGNFFRAVVDYKQIEAGNKLLNVTIQNVPVYLLSYEYYPKTVEYLKSRR